jgi:hypothetical protein
MSKNPINMILTLDFTCRAFFGRGDDAVFYWEDICFVSGSYLQTQPFVTSNYLGHEVGIVLGLLMEVSAN